MIYDRSFDQRQLYDFFSENADQFSSNLLEQIERSGNGTLEQYTEKLSRMATVACEKEDGRIKGVVIGYTHNLPEDRGSYITYVVVAPAFRRQGVMRRLLEEYEAYCRTMDVSYMWLATGKINKVAQEAYERCGFVCAGPHNERTLKYIKELKKDPD